MSHKAVLTKAINKAIDSGWKPNFDIKRYRLTIGFKIEKPFEMSGADWSVNDIIFNHDFARAIWGTKKLKWSFNEYDFGYEAWQLHLREMVIADDPLAYLGEHI